jgi:hypothetical protein
MKVSSVKQGPHMAKSHGLSLEYIQMELSGFNVEQKRNKQIIFYKLGKIYIRQDNKCYYSFSHSCKILHIFDINTILTSLMTSRIIVIFFPYKDFFPHSFHI